MHVVMVALGSRGDVQPFVALGCGLHAAGYRVTVVAPDDYADLVRVYGLRWRSAGGSIDALMDREMAYAALDGAGNPLRIGRRFFQAIDPLVERVMRACAAAARDADLLLASTLGVYIAANVAEAYNIPFVPCHMHPYGPTYAFPSMFFPALPAWLPHGAYNRLTHVLTDQSYWQALRWSLNCTRVDVLGLAPRSPWRVARTGQQQRGPSLLAYSPLVMPLPPDWGTDQHVTGYWRLPPPPGWTPPDELLRFLDAGDSPLYIGFGSMLAGRDPAAWTDAIVRAVAQTGRRAVVWSGWDDWAHGALPPTIFRTTDVPHTWLFQHMAAVVTHGGAGTTAAALHAGVPMVVVPFLGDQRMWAARLHALGVAASPLPRAAMTAERLAVRIVDATTPARQQAARTLGSALRAEDGIGRAVALLRNLGSGA